MILKLFKSLSLLIIISIWSCSDDEMVNDDTKIMDDPKLYTASERSVLELDISEFLNGDWIRIENRDNGSGILTNRKTLLTFENAKVTYWDSLHVTNDGMVFKHHVVSGEVTIDELGFALDTTVSCYFEPVPVPIYIGDILFNEQEYFDPVENGESFVDDLPPGFSPADALTNRDGPNFYIGTNEVQDSVFLWNCFAGRFFTRL